jgi:hypothetical protein
MGGLMTAATFFDVDLGLPDWFHVIDLDREADQSTVTAAIEEHLERLGATVNEEALADLATRALDVWTAARERSALGAALALDVVDRLPIPAYLLMYGVEGPDGTGPEALDELAQSLVDSTHALVGHREAKVVELNGRPAVRLAGFTSLDAEADRSPIVAVRQYRVPVPGSGTQFALVCWTPEIVVSDEMGELFDAIAESVTIT